MTRQLEGEGITWPDLNQTEAVRNEASWDWMMRGDLKETEELITAAQDQVLRTNVMKAKIEKQHAAISFM